MHRSPATRYTIGGSNTLRYAEFMHALPAPGEVIVFLCRRLLHLAAGFGTACGQRLSLVQGLRADLAGMVDAHETKAFRPLRRGEFAIRD